MLEEHHKGEVDLDLKHMIDTETLQMGLSLPPLYYHYKEGKKRKKSYLVFVFCPFCGKKMEMEEKKTEEKNADTPDPHVCNP